MKHPQLSEGVSYFDAFGRRDLGVLISSRSAGSVLRELHRQEGGFRSFRTYMSIEIRVSPFLRAFRSLIKHTRGPGKIY